MTSKLRPTIVADDCDRVCQYGDRGDFGRIIVLIHVNNSEDAGDEKTVRSDVLPFSKNLILKYADAGEEGG